MEILMYSCLAGLSTLLGAIIILISNPEHPLYLAILLGFAAGVMLAVVFFELIPSALTLGLLHEIILAIPVGGLIIGIISMVLHKSLPATGSEQDLIRIGYLITAGIALHNLPEGLAIGTGMAVSPELSSLIALSLGVHNIPEGMAAAGPLRAGKMSWISTLCLITMAGLVTPVGTLAGMLFINIFPELVGISLNIAAGAMLYLIIEELLPKARSYHAPSTNIGFFIGVITGMLLIN